MKRIKVIFLCTSNSARSQMAEAFLKHYAGEYFEVYSAGFDPKPIHPLTFKVMSEIGYNMSDQYPKDLSQFLGKIHFGIIITVCAKAEAKCPTFPGFSTRIFWDLEDPAAFNNTEEEKLNKFREIRDEIRSLIKSFLKERDIPIKFI